MCKIKKHNILVVIVVVIFSVGHVLRNCRCLRRQDCLCCIGWLCFGNVMYLTSQIEIWANANLIKFCLTAHNFIKWAYAYIYFDSVRYLWLQFATWANANLITFWFITPCWFNWFLFSYRCVILITLQSNCTTNKHNPHHYVCVSVCVWMSLSVSFKQVDVHLVYIMLHM
jgi:hypothetical protein